MVITVNHPIILMPKKSREVHEKEGKSTIRHELGGTISQYLDRDHLIVPYELKCVQRGNKIVGVMTPWAWPPIEYLIWFRLGRVKRERGA